MEKQILDVTCGSRSIWFNKNHPAAIYCDKRRVSWDIPFGKNGSVHACHIEPDIVCDFTALPFADESFQLVVFDPPHLTEAKETAWLVKKYGVLNDDWPQMLHDGFVECMRVLRVGGGAYIQVVGIQHPRRCGMERVRTKAFIRSPQREKIKHVLGRVYERIPV